jgi:hypothetical protein
MKNKIRRIKVVRLIYLLIVLNFLGCASFSTFQSPSVLEPGEKAVGIGFSSQFDTDDKMTLSSMDIYGRFGVIKNLDVGVRLSEFYPFLKVFTDVKYRILREPVVVSVNMGYSFYVEHIKTHGFYPMILFGKDNLYGGIKVILHSIWGRVEPFDKNVSTKYLIFPGFMVGTAFGDRTRLLLEANIYFTEDRNTPLIFMGVALQHNFLLE